MRSSWALLVLLAACRHVPPDEAARAAPPVAPVVRRVPRADELRGSWISVEVRGEIEGLGHTFLYCFGEEGRYTGAVTSESECVPLEGAYALRSGPDKATLTLDGGLDFEAAIIEERLELHSPGSYLVLRRLDSPQSATPPKPSVE